MQLSHAEPKTAERAGGGLDCFVSCFITFDNAIKLKHRQNLDSYSDWKFYITRLSSSLSKTYLDLIDKINKSLDKRVLSPPHYCCLDYQQAALQGRHVQWVNRMYEYTLYAVESNQPLIYEKAPFLQEIKCALLIFEKCMSLSLGVFACRCISF